MTRGTSRPVDTHRPSCDTALARRSSFPSAGFSTPTSLATVPGFCSYTGHDHIAQGIANTGGDHRAEPAYATLRTTALPGDSVPPPGIGLSPGSVRGNCERIRPSAVADLNVDGGLLGRDRRGHEAISIPTACATRCSRPDGSAYAGSNLADDQCGGTRNFVYNYGRFWETSHARWRSFPSAPIPWATSLATAPGISFAMEHGAFRSYNRHALGLRLSQRRHLGRAGNLAAGTGAAPGRRMRRPRPQARLSFSSAPLRL